MKYILILVLLLSGCGGLPVPKLAVTPVSATVKLGGKHITGKAEDNMVQVTTGTTSSYMTEKVEQTYNDVQEYPMWLVWAFALALGLAIPSPVVSYSGWKASKRSTAEINWLRAELDSQLNKLDKEPSHGSSTSSNLS